MFVDLGGFRCREDLGGAEEGETMILNEKNHFH